MLVPTAAAALTAKIHRQIAEIFPTADQIPPDFRLQSPVNQREYLINGELCHWNGEVEAVLSPIQIQTDQGLQPSTIGHFPLLTAQESLAALKAAVAADQQGREPWPAMSIAQRIEHVQDITYRMQEKRDEVVKLPFGKSPIPDKLRNLGFCQVLYLALELIKPPKYKTC